MPPDLNILLIPRQCIVTPSFAGPGMAHQWYVHTGSGNEDHAVSGISIPHFFAACHGMGVENHDGHA